MKYVAKNNDHNHDLYTFIYESIANTNYNEYREVDNSVGLITNLIGVQSRLIKLLFEKNVICESELKGILLRDDFQIEEE